ncbi:MAG: hypothetical protein JWM10_3185 [Myxococcaceae bacterium]|nr:hypothetical protein [Myxococcaceae bacterium]
MDKQPTRASNDPLETNLASRPQWWTDKHTSTWDRVKEALRRDWEQTRADFSADDAVDLNQNAADTVKQAVGAQPLPPPTVKTHPDDPQDAAKAVEKRIKEQGKAEEKLVEARTDVAVEQVRAQGKVVAEQQAAQEKLAAEQRRLGEISAEAREAAAKTQRDAQEKIAKQQQKIAEVRADAGQKIAEVQQKAGEKIAEVQQKAAEKVGDALPWARVEPAVRYGYVARLQYPEAGGWDDALDGRLRSEWTQMRGDGSWEDVRPHVRRGWDAAARNSVV